MSNECAVAGQHIEVTLDPNPIGTSSPEWQTTGAIDASQENSFVIDTCPPGSGCAPTFVKVVIEAPGLHQVLPVGAFINLHVVTHHYGYNNVATMLSVRNVPTWQGIVNPVSNVERWYLLTSEQSLEHPDAPFQVSSHALQCPLPTEGGAGKLHELTFTDLGGSSTTLGHGQPATLKMAGQTWNVQVLRAFEPYGFDYPDPYTWYASSSE